MTEEEMTASKERISSLEIRSRVLLLANGRGVEENRDRILAFLDQLDDDQLCKECSEERTLICDNCGFIPEGE